MKLKLIIKNKGNNVNIGDKVKFKEEDSCLLEKIDIKFKNFKELSKKLNKGEKVKISLETLFITKKGKLKSNGFIEYVISKLDDDEYSIKTPTYKIESLKITEEKLENFLLGYIESF